jgi:CRISPR-associated exonuclease Cas4
MPDDDSEELSVSPPEAVADTEAEGDATEGSETALPTYTGTQVNYYMVCPRKLWLFSHQIEMERNSDLVQLGRLLHDHTYSRERKKNLIIDNRIVVDFYEDGTLHEVKKSNRLEDAHRLQLLYYLYYLKQKGAIGITGELNYPKLKQRTQVQLTSEAEAEVEQVLAGIRDVLDLPQAPAVINAPYCKRCSYVDFCYA